MEEGTRTPLNRTNLAPVSIGFRCLTRVEKGRKIWNNGCGESIKFSPSHRHTAHNSTVAAWAIQLDFPPYHYNIDLPLPQTPTINHTGALFHVNMKWHPKAFLVRHCGKSDRENFSKNSANTHNNAFIIIGREKHLCPNVCEKTTPKFIKQQLE